MHSNLNGDICEDEIQKERLAAATKGERRSTAKKRLHESSDLPVRLCDDLRKLEAR